MGLMGVERRSALQRRSIFCIVLWLKQLWEMQVAIENRSRTART
jgi:hypothetical protein